MNAADAERLLREQKLGGKCEPGVVFELDRVAQAVPPEREVHQRSSKEYREYQVPEDKRDLLTYPPADFVPDLLTLEKPGDALVIADQPIRNFYVAVLAHRDEPSIKEFFDLYAKQDVLYNQFSLQRTRQYYEKAMTQLRTDAVPADKIDKDGHFLVPEQLRKRNSDRPNEAE